MHFCLMQPPPGGIGAPIGNLADRFQMESYYIEKPLSLRIVSPEAKEMDVPSKLTIMRTTAGRITWISTLPLATAAEFREVVNELRRLLEAWEIEPSEAIRRWIEQDTNWPGNESVPMAMPFRTQVQASPSVVLGIVIRPAPERGWFLSLTFAVDEAERYKLLPPEDRPEPYQ